MAPARFRNALVLTYTGGLTLLTSTGLLSSLSRDFNSSLIFKSSFIIRSDVAGALDLSLSSSLASLADSEMDLLSELA